MEKVIFYYVLKGSFETDTFSVFRTAPVIVLGATNRPMDIDSAFLRRMPLTIQTQAPDYNSRVDIITKMLKVPHHIYECYYILVPDLL